MALFWTVALQALEFCISSMVDFRMNFLLNTSPARNHQQSRRAFTLIEMVGVLAVIAILAVALLPVLIKSTDKLVSDQETATLQSFNNALLNSIQRNRYVPSLAGSTNLANTLATELAMNVSDVYTNARHQPRYFFYDPNINIDGNTYTSITNGGYVQDPNGSANLPASPRVIILSSIGKPITGTYATSDFNTLWTTADNAAISNVSLLGTWNGMNSSGSSDIVIQRINLSQCFVHLLLSSNNSSAVGYYSFDTNSHPTQITNLDAYLINGSVLSLYTNLAGAGGSAMLESRQILNSDSSFVFYANDWRSVVSASGGGSLASSTNLAAAADFATLASGFLASPASTNNANASPSAILTDYTNYMGAYNAWAAGGFTNAALYKTATNAYFTFANALVILGKSLGLTVGTPK
jgi:prepilin-type N-terminal cleavage/methylation domain-containing protein